MIDAANCLNLKTRKTRDMQMMWLGAWREAGSQHCVDSAVTSSRRPVLSGSPANLGVPPWPIISLAALSMSRFIDLLRHLCAVMLHKNPWGARLFYCRVQQQQ